MSKERNVVRLGAFKDVITSGVRQGDLITLSGQVSVDADGRVVGPGDLAAQVRQAYANVREVLDAFGASMDDIVDEMWLVTDVQATMAHIEPLWAIRAEAFGRDPEVSQTLVQIGALVMPDLMIEIKCIARV